MTTTTEYEQNLAESLGFSANDQNKFDNLFSNFETFEEIDQDGERGMLAYASMEGESGDGWSSKLLANLINKYGKNAPKGYKGPKSAADLQNYGCACRGNLNPFKRNLGAPLDGLDKACNR